MRTFVDRARNPKGNLLYMLRQAWSKDVRMSKLRRRWGPPPAIVAGTTETERGIKPTTRVADHLHPNLHLLADRLAYMVIHTHEIAKQAFILNGNVSYFDGLSNFSSSPAS